MADRYRRRLEQDLDRWIEAGLVPADNRAAILSDIAPAPGRWTPQGAAAILGAVLLALAALSFIAANWSALSPLSRFGVILAALWASFAGSGFAFARKSPAVGHALALLAAVFFGGAIILTAQTFNMSAFTNTGVLIWALGATAIAVAAPSRPVLIAASIIGGYWTVMETTNAAAGPIVWTFPLLFLAIAAPASWLKSNITMTILTLALGWWIVLTLAALHDLLGLDELELAALLPIIGGVLALWAGVLRGWGVHGASVVAAWAAMGAAGALFAIQVWLFNASNAPGLLFLLIAAPIFGLGLIAGGLQVARSKLQPSALTALGVGGLAVIAVPYLATSGPDYLPALLEFGLGAVVFAVAAVLILIGAQAERSLIGVIGVVLFIAQALYVYVELFGDLLSTSVFFFVGGVLLMALAVIIPRVRKQLVTLQSGGQS